MDFKKNGLRLRELRGKRTVQEVANNLGISTSALTMYENGDRNPRDDVKIALARYYGVGVVDIFYPNDYTKSEVS